MVSLLAGCVPNVQLDRVRACVDDPSNEIRQVDPAYFSRHVASTVEGCLSLKEPFTNLKESEVLPTRAAS